MADPNPNAPPPNPNPAITVNGNNIEYKHYAWPVEEEDRNISRSKDVPDDEQQSQIDVLFEPWGCYAHLNPTCDSAEWEGSGMNYYYIYQPTNPVCGYAGKFEFKLTNTCAGGGGGGGGDGNEPTYTLSVDGEATNNLIIHEQNTPEEDGPFAVCVDGDLVVESALERSAGTTTTVPSIWTVNDFADARDDGIHAPETFETFHIPDDFPAAFLDADGKPIPDTYNLTATYECPASSTTLTATTTVTVFELNLTASGSLSSDATHIPQLAGDPNYLLIPNMKRLPSGAEAFSKVELAATVNPSPPSVYGPPMWHCVNPPGVAEFAGSAPTATGWTATYQHMSNNYPLKPQEYIFEASWGVDSSGNFLCTRQISVYVVQVQITELADLVFADDDGGDLPVTAAVEGIDSIGTGAATLEVDSSSEANIRLTVPDVPSVGLLEHDMGTKYYVKDKDYQAAARGNGDSAEYTFFLVPGSLPSQSPIREDSSGVKYDATQMALLDIEFDFHVEDGTGTVLTNSVRPLSVAANDFTFFDSEVKTVNIGQGAGAPYGPDADVTVQTVPGKGMRDPDGDGDNETYQKRPYGSWHEEPDPGFDDPSFANLYPIGEMDCQLYDSNYSVDGGNKWVAHARGDWTAMITVSYGLKRNPSAVTPSHYVIDPDFVESDDLGGEDHLKLNMAEQDPDDDDEETKIVYMVSCMGDDSEAAGALLKQAAIFSASVAVAGIGSVAAGVTIATGVTVGTVAEWIGAGISVSGLVSAGMKSLDDRVDETAFAKQTGNVCIQSAITRAPFSGSSTPDDDWDHSELAPGLADNGNSSARFFGEVLAGDKVSVSLEVSQNIYAESRNWFDVWLRQETTFNRKMKSSGTVEWVSGTE